MGDFGVCMHTVSSPLALLKTTISKSSPFRFWVSATWPFVTLIVCRARMHISMCLCAHTRYTNVFLYCVCAICATIWIFAFMNVSVLRWAIFAPECVYYSSFWCWSNGTKYLIRLDAGEWFKIKMHLFMHAGKYKDTTGVELKLN